MEGHRWGGGAIYGVLAREGGRAARCGNGGQMGGRRSQGGQALMERTGGSTAVKNSTENIRHRDRVKDFLKIGTLFVCLLFSCWAAHRCGSLAAASIPFVLGEQGDHRC